MYHVHHVVFQHVLIRFRFLHSFQIHLVFPTEFNKSQKQQTLFYHTDFAATGRVDLVLSFNELPLLVALMDGTGTVCSCWVGCKRKD